MCELSTGKSKAPIFSNKCVGRAFWVLLWLSIGGCATQSKVQDSPVAQTESSNVSSSSATADATNAKSTDETAPATAPAKTVSDEKTAETNTETKNKAAPKKIAKKKVDAAPKQVKKETSTPEAKKAATPPAKKSKVAVKKAPEKAPPVIKEKTVSTAPAAAVKNIVESEAPEKVAAESDLTASKQVSPMADLVEFSSLDQLPLALSSDWGIDVFAPPGETKKACLLSHEKENVFDGYEETTIGIIIGIDKVWFRSKSNLDLSYPETGYQVMDIDGNVLQTNTLQLTQRPDAAYVEASIASLPLQSADMVIKTGFWPSWPVTETKSFSVSVRHAKALTSALQTCARLLN